MWFYTADTVTRVTSTRRPAVAARAPRQATSHRVAGVLRSLADRIDATPAHRPATDC